MGEGVHTVSASASMQRRWCSLVRQVARSLSHQRSLGRRSTSSWRSCARARSGRSVPETCWLGLGFGFGFGLGSGLGLGFGFGFGFGLGLGLGPRLGSLTLSPLTQTLTTGSAHGARGALRRALAGWRAWLRQQRALLALSGTGSSLAVRASLG